MTPQQQARLIVVAEMVTTAQQLLQQANAAMYAPDMGDVPFAVKAAIGNALIRAKDAAGELTPLVKEVAA